MAPETQDVPATILLYHRVASDPVDAQSLCVSERNFEAHLSFLRERRTVLPLDDLLREAFKGRVQPGAVAITFDDGYRDNFVTASPLLSRYGFTATVFVVTGFLGSSFGFWGDAFEGLFFSNLRRPETLRLGGRCYSLSTAVDVIRTHDALRSDLRRLPHPVIRQRLAEIAVAMNGNLEQPSSRAIVGRDELADSPLLHPALDFGAHTVTHSMLSSLDVAEQREELAGSKRTLEGLLCRPIRLFAYPYGSLGSYTEATVMACREVGFAAAFSNTQMPLLALPNAFEVPRTLVRDWSAEEFAAWMEDGCPRAHLQGQLLARNRRLCTLLASQGLPRGADDLDRRIL